MLYKEGDFVTVHSKVSKYNGKFGQVVCYTNGKCKDIVKVSIDEKFINLKEDSLDFTSAYDVIRNMTDKELKTIVSTKIINKIEKSLKNAINDIE